MAQKEKKESKLKEKKKHMAMKWFYRQGEKKVGPEKTRKALHQVFDHTMAGKMKKKHPRTVDMNKVDWKGVFDKAERLHEEKYK